MTPLERFRQTVLEMGDPMPLLEGLFSWAPVGLQVYDATGRCLVVNEVFRQMFGTVPPAGYNVLRDEIAEKNGVLDLVHRAFAGETTHIPPIWYDARELTQVKVTEARRVAVASTFFPIRDTDGRVTHVAIAFTDVTHAVEAREQAEEERDLLRAIFEQSGDGIMVCDAQGVVRGLNPEAARQHGVSRKAVGPAEWASIYGLRTLAGDPMPLEEVPLYRALKGERVEDARWKVRRPDGEERILTGTALPLRRPDGTPAGAVATSRDETERLRLEDELRQESGRNQRLYAEAQELDRAKGEFLATVSHELRTPLQSIVGWARLLHEPEIRDDPPRYAQALETIERNARLQARLVDDILDASRIVTGSTELHWGPVDLAAIARSAAEGLRSGAEAKGLALTVDLPPGPLLVTGDADRLHQVAWNVVGNALKFTAAGGRVTVAAREEDGIAVLRVTDSGEGIAPEFLDGLFQPFRQADGSTTRAHGGLGLGLSIARHYVERQGGTIEVQSAGRGKGAAFTIRLKLREAAPAPPARPDPERGPQRPLDGLRVVVVEDEADTRDLLATMLSRQGAAVDTAPSAADGFEAVRRRPPDVLVCDIGMAGEDGYSLLSRVRALPSGEGGAVPAVALTAYARAEDRRRALDAGYQVHLAKPVDPDELIRTVARMAGRAVAGPAA